MDNYCTPRGIASLMAQRAIGYCLEPAAGRGELAQYLPSGTNCIEIDPARKQAGYRLAPHCFWHCFDFLEYTKSKPPNRGVYDTVITNPPFSQLIPYIRAGLQWVQPEGKLLYLMPIDWMASKGRAAEWEAIYGHISAIYVIKGRVDYLLDGEPMSQLLRPNGKKHSGRQCYDAVFEIRVGKTPNNAFQYL